MNAVELTAALVEYDSRNPSLVPGAPGEHGVAHFLARLLATWGFRTEMMEVTAGRCNLVARGGGASPAMRSLVLNGHLDVVGTEGMAHAPFSPVIVDGRLYGRGSADMKGGIAAMCLAARDAVASGIGGEVIVTAVIDEEYESLGTRALIESGLNADAAVITEPTRLAIAPAHRGFVWARLDFRGRAAHGSRYDIGVDAISHAAAVMTELDRYQREVLVRHSHPLLGHPSLHASRISGGTGISTYPESCTLEIERRTLPGEDDVGFRAELNDAIEAARRSYRSLDVDVSITTAQGPSDVPEDSLLVREIARAIESEQLPVRVEGLSAWTDAALLNAAGIPTVCFGPGDISMAHAATEWIPTHEIHTAHRVLRRLVSTWCNTQRGSDSDQGEGLKCS